MLTGSCVCGAIQFEFEPMPGRVLNCHCSLCRKSHGAAFATQVFANRPSLRLLKGREQLKEYQSPRGIRAFCSHCGSRLMNYARDDGAYLSIAASCIDSPFTDKALAHCFVASKAPWHEPSADIPSYPELPPPGQLT